MSDIVFLVILVASFALLVLFVSACDRIIGADAEAFAGATDDEQTSAGRLADDRQSAGRAA